MFRVVVLRFVVFVTFTTLYHYGVDPEVIGRLVQFSTILVG